MTETNTKIPFSTMRREIRKIMKNPPSKNETFPVIDFMPSNIKIWIGHDSDHFKRSFCHHRMILKIILTGNASTNIEGIRYKLTPGDAVVYFPMQTHSTEITDNKLFEYLAISFIDDKGRYDQLELLKNRVFTPDPENLFLIEMVKAWNENHQMRVACLLAELLSYNVSRLSQVAINPIGEFSDITEYIQKNYKGELSVKKIAAQFDISPQSVRRIFQRNITGLTPSLLIRQQKMFLAEELLRRTNLTLADIAKQCGFASEFSFSRAFKRAYDMPPILYRKTHSSK